MTEDIKTEMLGGDTKASFIKLINYIDGLEKRVEILEHEVKKCKKPLKPLKAGPRRPMR